MRITQMYYGDYHIIDDFPFNVITLEGASDQIYHDYGVRVHSWPITIDLNEKLGLWEVWFTRPATDKEYVEYMEDLPEVPGRI